MNSYTRPRVQPAFDQGHDVGVSTHEPAEEWGGIHGDLMGRNDDFPRETIDFPHRTVKFTLGYVDEF